MGVTFSRESAERVGRVVRKFERQFQPGVIPQRRSPIISNNGFWARLDDVDTDTGRYGWVALEPTSSDSLDENSDWGFGNPDASEGYAVEVDGLVAVPAGTIVFLRASVVQPYFLFDYQGLLPFRYDDTISGDDDAIFIDHPNGNDITGSEFNVGDLPDVFADATDDSKGWCVKFAGAFQVVQLECP